MSNYIALAGLFDRELNRLKTEINNYNRESAIWQKDKQINNSAGNLALHLCGNLEHFIGHVLGGSSYQRNRKNEFEGRVTREEIAILIDSARKHVKATLEKLTNEEGQKEFPIQVFDRPFSTEEFIYHLYGHLTYHIGQISYHRRLIDY